MNSQDVVSFCHHFRLDQEGKKSIIPCTFNILKCPTQTDQGSSSNSQKPSCKWFQADEFKETAALLLPKIEEMVSKKIPAHTKQASISILTGKSVKVAYCFADNLNFGGRVLTSTETNENNSPWGSFTAHRFSRTKIIVSATQCRNQKDVCRLTKVLSQQCNLTDAKIEISHYFNHLGIKHEKQSDNEDNDPVSVEQPENAKETQRILRKLASDGLLKEKDKKTRKSRLRMRKRCAELAEENDPDAVPVCSQSKSRKPSDTQTDQDENLSQTLHVKDLSLKQLEESFERNSAYLWDIYKGETECKRHAKYANGSAKQRRELDFQVNLTFYHEEQVDHAIAMLKKLLAPDGDKKIDYILRVLLPEFLIKVYMDLKGVDQELAELKMQPCGSKRNIESPVKHKW